jgi:hypothetical protein
MGQIIYIVQYFTARHFSFAIPPLIHQLSAFLYTVAKLAELLLIVIRRKSAHGTKKKRHRSSTTSLDDSRYSRAGKEDTVGESKLRSVVLVVLEEIACAL